MAFSPSVAGSSQDTIKEEKTEHGGRIKGLQLFKPVVYGTVAYPLNEKRPDGRTHKWTVFLRPYNNEDLSVFIKKVNFKLHESYTNCNRMVSKLPYEVSETGWGEFEIVIKIYFQDPNERPVTLYHVLKLFHSGPNANNPSIVNTPVIKESYDEIVFQDPTVLMKSLLTRSSEVLPDKTWEDSVDFETLKVETVEKFSEARKKIQNELEEQKAKLKIAQETLMKFKEEVMKIRKATPATSYLSLNY